MAHPMGESKRGPLRVGFDRRLKLEFHGSEISSDAGLLPYCELDDALGLSALAGDVLSEVRRGKNARHQLWGFCSSRCSVAWPATRMSMTLSGWPAIR